jgi:hypothetical protein
MTALVDELPVLDGFIGPDGVHVFVWCQHCRRLHSHGHGGPDAPIGAGDGHRVAHCSEPRTWSWKFGYVWTGYIIREVGQFTSAAQMRRYEQQCRAAERGRRR